LESQKLFEARAVDYRSGKCQLVFVVWSLEFSLQLFGSERSNMKKDKINTLKGYKSVLIWKPRLSTKEGIFRK